uniref:Uncharacterized protein n=1 Tax=Asparagus officinalis TaxID=4686 RepID=Q2XNS7_ASPOF|nr:hypothetical protein 12.t00009 [Asparagus officinalis]ABB55345.1 hypothetical protein 9.t00008 [Asparagus officinalis]
MVTPLGTSFSDEEVVVQFDINLTGTTVETLIIEFNQAKYEELLSFRSLSPKAMRKICKVFKETKTPIVAPMPKEALSFSQDCSNSPSSEGVGSAYAKRSPQWHVVQLKRSLQGRVSQTESNSQECVPKPKRRSQDCIPKPKCRSQDCVSSAKCRPQDCVSPAKPGAQACVRVTKSNTEPGVYLELSTTRLRGGYKKSMDSRHFKKIHVHQEPIPSNHRLRVPIQTS